MKKLVTIILVAAGVLISMTFSAHAAITDAVAAVVDGEIITRSEVDEAAQLLTQKTGESAQWKLALEKLVEQHLIAKQAKRFRITISEEELAMAIEQIKKRTKMSDETLRKEIAKRGITWEQYTSGLKKEILTGRTLGYAMRSEMKFNEKGLKKFYLKNVTKFKRQGKIRMLHMVVPLAADVDALQRVREEMNRGADPLEAGKALIGVSPYDTGMIPLGGLKEPFLSAIAETPVGNATRIISTPEGHNLLFITERTDAAIAPFEEVRGEVEALFVKEGEKEFLQNWVQQLKDEAEIKYMQ